MILTIPEVLTVLYGLNNKIKENEHTVAMNSFFDSNLQVMVN